MFSSYVKVNDNVDITPLFQHYFLKHIVFLYFPCYHKSTIEINVPSETERDNVKLFEIFSDWFFFGDKVGFNEDLVGELVVGFLVGDLVGDLVGELVVGFFVGDLVGDLVGEFVGVLVGFLVGELVGLVGFLVGADDGSNISTNNKLFPICIDDVPIDDSDPDPNFPALPFPKHLKVESSNTTQLYWYPALIDKILSDPVPKSIAEYVFIVLDCEFPLVNLSPCPNWPLLL